MKTYNIPIFIPHEGCPHDCVFCNQRKITGVSTSVTPDDAKMIIEKYLSYLNKKDARIEVAFFGGSFTGLPIELQEEFYDIANSFGDEIDGIRLSTRPDYINENILSLAKKSRVNVIELGVQSAFDDVLNANNRGHSYQQTVEGVKLIKRAGIGLGVQMMTGLYGSTPEKDMKTAKILAELEPICARIYPTIVLKGTYLETLYKDGKYCPQSIEDAIETAKSSLLYFREKKISVIRLGLHAGEEIRKPDAVVAGPFHPAFGELVESRIYRDEIEKKINEAKNGILAVKVSANEVSKAVGHKRCNINYFKEKYSIELKIAYR